MSDTVDFDNLDEALDYIISELEAHDQLKHVKESENPEVFTARMHFGFGMQLRNNLGLWKPHTQSRLVKWFWDNLHITHADDMSAIILTALWYKAHDKKFSLKHMQEMAEKFQAHWYKTMQGEM